MKTILVTGASGFVGQSFCQKNDERYIIKRVSLKNTAINEIDLSGVNVILHLAGIAHRMGKTDDSLYYDVNFELTRELAKASKMNGVEHFIFMSTVKVYGDHSQHLSVETPCKPNDAYGKSKLMAEEAILELASSSFGVAIVRSPLIYGPGVKGNMGKLIELVETKRFIPLGNINNQRSLVGVENLIALFNTIIAQNAQGIFLVQDPEPVSTSELVREIATAKETEIRLISIPKFLRGIVRLIFPNIYIRLFETLVLDDVKTRDQLGFVPSTTLSEGIKSMIKKDSNEQVTNT